MFRVFGVESKKDSDLSLDNIVQISFSELYMERSSKTNEFFKRLNTLIHWEGMEK
ncbi:MAG: hypothetical protein ACMUEL_00010 [Flavobacteriales bacterium Tduv]